MDAEELHRHRCEVREWLRRGADQPREWLVSVLQGVARRRGKQAAERLRADLREQWQRGNRGEPGDWREGERS